MRMSLQEFYSRYGVYDQQQAYEQMNRQTSGQAAYERMRRQEAADREYREQARRNAEYENMFKDSERFWRGQQKPPPPQQPRTETLSFDKDLLRKLIMLCHPDKHGGSSMANEVTVLLLKMKEKR